MKIFFSICFSACYSGLLDDLVLQLHHDSVMNHRVGKGKIYEVVETGSRAGCILWLKNYKMWSAASS
jgi:hypothetical protein